MDPATLIGILLAFVVVVVVNMLEGGNPMAMLILPPILLVFGATLLVCMAGGTMADTKLAYVGLKNAFAGKVPTAVDLVPELVTLADKARREGLLALEDAVAEIDDPFLARALTLAIDGSDPEDLRDILEAEIRSKKSEHKQAAKYWNSAGGYAPTIGIVGTVMGLIHVLEQLSEPEKLGHLIAAAFVATLWGVLSANAIFLPVGARLQRLGELEIARMELVVEGVSALQAGSNPRLLAQRLRALLPAAEREEEAA